MSGIVIIGGGQAGSTLAFKLRDFGYAGQVTLISEEPMAPYHRPPLSKGFLLGKVDRESLHIRPVSLYKDRNIDLVLNTRVEKIDRVNRRIEFRGEAMDYEQLAFTTGAKPIAFPAHAGGGHPKIHMVRGIADIERMKADFVPGARLLVVGGGYIGLEVAAVAAASGLIVTVVEAAGRILQRVASPATSDFFRKLHRENGVRIIEGQLVSRFDDRQGALSATLQSGETIAADLAVIGIGVRPTTDLAREAGLTVDDGIVVDAFGRTSDPHIVAAGDCARFPREGDYLRLESVPHAIHHAEVVAANLTGQTQPYVPRPWFWSDQFNVKLQIAGLGKDADVWTRRDEGGGSCSVWYFRGTTLLAVDAMNSPRAYMTGRRWIEAGLSPDRLKIGETGIALADQPVSRNGTEPSNQSEARHG